MGLEVSSATQLFKPVLGQRKCGAKSRMPLCRSCNFNHSSQAHQAAAAPCAVTKCTITLLGNIVLPESTLLQSPQPLSFPPSPIQNHHLQPASPFLIRTKGTRPLCPLPCVPQSRPQLKSNFNVVLMITALVR